MLTKPRPGRPADPRRLAFEAAVARAGGNLTKAAEDLGVAKSTASLWHKLARAGTLLDPFKRGP